MPSAYSIALAVQKHIPRRWLALAANGLMALKGDRRRYGVDRSGNWINAQPEGTFVSPDIYTRFYAQVEENVFDYWCASHQPQAGDTIIDVGAGIGDDAVVFSRLVGPTGRVIAIEAHPKTFACLQGTIERSRLSNVVAVQCAIADHDGTLTMSDDEAHLSNSVLKTDGGVEVPAKTLDTLLTELGIGEVGLLKMNIEGAERPAMSGMRRAAPNIRNVAISCHDFVADDGGGDDFRTRAFVQPALEEMGFAVRNGPDGPDPWLIYTLYGKRKA